MITISFPYMLVGLSPEGQLATAQPRENSALPMRDGPVLALEHAKLSTADIARLGPGRSRAALMNLAEELFYISNEEAEFLAFLTEQEVSS